MTVVSKMVRYGEKSLRQVTTGDDENRSKLLLALDERYGAGMGEAAAFCLDRTRGDAQAGIDRLSAADRENVRQLGDTIEPRDRRGLLTIQANGTLGQIRGVSSSVGGRAAIEGMGFSGRTPRDADGVHQLGRHVIEAFEKRGLPQALRDAGADISGMFERLRSEIAALGEVLDELARETREAQSAQLAKDAALEGFEDGFSAYAGLLTHYLRMAGMDAEADRLRPSARRAGRTDDVAAEEDADVAADDAPATDAV